MSLFYLDLGFVFMTLHANWRQKRQPNENIQKKQL